MSLVSLRYVSTIFPIREFQSFIREYEDKDMAANLVP
jgi:hypothetical protein